MRSVWSAEDLLTDAEVAHHLTSRERDDLLHSNCEHAQFAQYNG